MALEVVGNPSQLSAAVGCPTAKVLVVDDDEHFRALARVILEQAGYEVIESENVQQSMLQLRCNGVDALILDLFMPDVDGIEALGELKRECPEIRIVTVSGAKQAAPYLSMSRHLGADASLEKARIGELCPLLKGVLETVRRDEAQTPGDLVRAKRSGGPRPSRSSYGRCRS